MSENREAIRESKRTAGFSDRKIPRVRAGQRIAKRYLSQYTPHSGVSFHDKYVRYPCRLRRTHPFQGFFLSSQEKSYNISNAITALQAETDLADKAEIPGISDNLLNEIYLHWDLLNQELKSQSAEAGLDYILPVYTNLNILLHIEEGLSNPIPSQRIIKMTSVLAHLFAGVLQASREYLTGLDLESYTYQTRIEGL